MFPIRPSGDDAEEDAIGVEVEEGGDGLDGEGVEEAKTVKQAKDPKAPTAAEREAHEATHLPFRSWCRECVAGRRDNPPHRRKEDEERVFPEVSMDYAFVRRQDETETVTVLVVKDRDSRGLRTSVMKQKGIIIEESADKAADMVKGFGHQGKILMKVDNERALVALRKEVISRLGCDVIPVKPPEGESQSNGGVENGVKLFKGVLRVHLLALEKKLEAHIPSAHPIMTWLVEFVSDVITKYLQGSDGKSAYQRLFGKNVQEEGLEFGERVMYKTRKTQDMNVVLDARWQPGLWLGRTWGSISHRVATSENEVIEVRAVHRVPKGERWESDAINKLRATTWQWTVPAGAPVPVVVLGPREAAPGEADPVPVPVDRIGPKRIYIRTEDLETTGTQRGVGDASGRAIDRQQRGRSTRSSVESG